ncbi:MAG: nucleotidyltransferase family protein [Dongiaceae bacterium]
MNERLTVLLLAGSRGPADPVAQAAEVPVKALAPVRGRAMIERVVDTLQRYERIGRIVIATDDRPEAAAQFERLARRAGVELMAQAQSPAATVSAALAHIGDAGFPILVTTADHPLLTADMIETLLNASLADADIAVALADADNVAAAYPNSIRTVLKLGSGRYCGCNLFLLQHPRAGGAIAFWRRMERNRKKPWRLAAAIGPKTLMLYLLGRLDLTAAFARLSALSASNIQPVILPQPEAAIDVDKPADLALAERILAARERPES